MATGKTAALAMAAATVLLVITGIQNIFVYARADDGGECGRQLTPQQTWQSWHEHYRAGRWKDWYSCHDEAARAGLFLMAFLYTPDSKAKQRVMQEYGLCQGRSRPSMECITENNAADFFHDVTVTDEEAARLRLASIWSGDGTMPLPDHADDVQYQDVDHASMTLSPAVEGQTVIERAISFVRTGGRWYVTFRWGM